MSAVIMIWALCHLITSSSFLLADVHLTSDTLLLQYIFDLTVEWMGFTEQY